MFRWLEIFLPNYFKTVEDYVFSDEYSIQILQEAEDIITKLIKQGNKYTANRTIRKKHLEYKIVVKIRRKKISVMIQEAPLAKTKYKKKIVLRCYRKHYKTNKGERKWIETSIQYIENGKPVFRNVRKSPFMQTIFYKIDQLDAALMGQLIENNPPPFLPTTPASNKGTEIYQLFWQTKKYLSDKGYFMIDPLIENRLQRIFTETEKLLPDFDLLDIEERYTVKRMLQEDLPNLLNTYASLSTSNQLEQKENLFVTLSKMELSLLKLTEKIEGLRLKKMEHLMKVNEQRYDTNE